MRPSCIGNRRKCKERWQRFSFSASSKRGSGSILLPRQREEVALSCCPARERKWLYLAAPPERGSGSILLPRQRGSCFILLPRQRGFGFTLLPRQREDLALSCGPDRERM
ncbi:hypothetical protein JTE90_010039 [Oedothorax gibbosus]|uniref:Uncharacterized protein n=1 Tax=Oedothorax gibbosus TaxID=931172 RepID=A0AAV6V354_9ARAC|nr:hypothetical protein JTE90_010039 [Oedothorax gibbosus]